MFRMMWILTAISQDKCSLLYFVEPRILYLKWRFDSISVDWNNLVQIILIFRNLTFFFRWNFGIELVWWNFQGFGTGSFIWLVMVATTILLFCCFKVWAVQRNRLKQNCKYAFLVRLYTFNNLLELECYCLLRCDSDRTTYGTVCVDLIELCIAKYTWMW